jgi:hypothetical protein
MRLVKKNERRENPTRNGKDWTKIGCPDRGKPNDNRTSGNAGICARI